MTRAEFEKLLDDYQSSIHSSIAADANFSGCSPAEVESRLNKVKAARQAILDAWDIRSAVITQLAKDLKVYREQAK